MLVDKNKFLEWYKVKGAGAALENASKWFDKVEANHQPLRKFLGGVRTHKECDIEPDKEEQIEGVAPDRVLPIYEQIYRAIPNFFYAYNIPPQKFCSPFYTTIHSTRKTKWGKFITAWMDRNGPITENQQKLVDQALAELGQLHAEVKVNKIKLFLNLTTDPAAFVRLSSYGVDAGGCFGNGGLNDIHRFMIGQTPHSFVGLISRNKPILDEKTADTDNIVLRMWGVADPSMKAFHIFNTYPRTPTYVGSIMRCLSDGFSQVIGVPVTMKANCIKTEGVFYNPQSHKVYHDPEFRWDYDRLVMDISGLEEYRRCFKCGHMGLDLRQTDIYQVCTGCRARLGKPCAITGEITVDRYEIMYKGKKSVVLRSIFEEQSATCKYTQNSYLKEDLELDSTGEYVSLDYAKASMKKCKNPQCSRWNNRENKTCGSCRKAFEAKKEVEV